MPNLVTPLAIIQKAPVVKGGPTPATQAIIDASTPVAVPALAPLEITRFQFRKLFTLAERLAIDNAQYNASLPGSIKAAIFTMQKDMEVSAMVNMRLPDTILGVNFLASIGILTKERAARILGNQLPL